jgi:hypothetical protein
MAARKYDSTVARIAGNILSGAGLKPPSGYDTAQRDADAARWAVGLARLVVAETERADRAEAEGE